MSSNEIRMQINANNKLIEEYLESKSKLISLNTEISDVKTYVSTAENAAEVAIVIDSTPTLLPGITEIKSKIDKCEININEICRIIDNEILKLNKANENLTRSLAIALHREELARKKREAERKMQNE